jgi:glyoxylase-like metal-dependent hydrolase (beta-lactamase superfamily II)
MSINIDHIIKPVIYAFFDKDSSTFTYIVKDPNSSACAIVDSVMDLDYASGTISLGSADTIIKFILEHKMTLELQIETHVHADHLSAAPYIQDKLGGKIGIGEKITVVQDTFGKIFNEGTEFARDGSQFDILFTDGQKYKIGTLECIALHTPGHTPACMTHLIGDAAFVGDTLFMPDIGTARADFPGGNAEALYNSIQHIFELPDNTRLFMCHDYPETREVEYETTIAEEKAHNIHIRDGISKEKYVNMRESRDKTLSMPRLILPSLQVNMRAGHLPPEESNGLAYLKIPVNAFR